MVVQPGDGHDGLQFVHSSRLTQPFNDGMQHFPHSDKQVVAEQKEPVTQSKDTFKIQVYENGSGGAGLAHHEQKRYFGLKRTVFCVLVAALLALVIIAAISGGLAASRASRSGSHIVQLPPASSTVRSTATASAGPSSIAASTQSSGTATSSTRTYLSAAPTATTTTNGMGKYDCPSENGTFYKSTLYPQTFEILCNSDWPSGMAGINGGTVIDLNDGVVATSIQACIDQCAANNAGGGECSVVAYGANITLALSRGGITGNCFMKTQRGATIVADTSGQAIAAFRVSN